MMRAGFALTAILLAAAPAAAQRDAPSSVKGFFAGASLVGASLDTDTDDDLDAFSGGGLGLELGWGFSSGLALFLAADGGSLDRDEVDDVEIDRRVQVDLGARMNFGAGRRRLVPFLEAAFTGLVLEAEGAVANGAEYGGAGISIGGGVQYFVSPSISLNAGLRTTAGAITEVKVEGEDEDDVDDQFFTTSRILLGATWHP